jgi:hypothetical protein
LIKQGQNVTTYFAETDYLGSIIGLMNPGGTYAEQFSFDACSIGYMNNGC